MNEPAQPARVPLTSVIRVLIYHLELFLVLGSLAALATKVLADRFGWPLASAVMSTLALAGAVGYGWAYQRMRIRERMVIRRGCADLFRLLVDAYLQPPGQAGTAGRRVVAREQTTAGPVGRGTAWREVIEQGARQVEWHYVVTTYELNRRFAVRATSPQWAGAHMAAGWLLIPGADGTQVIFTSVLRPGGVWRLFAPFMAQRYREQARMQAGALKLRLER